MLYKNFSILMLDENPIVFLKCSDLNHMNAIKTISRPNTIAV
jgi:hypothetical protein